MDIINERSALARTRRAIARGSLNVGILGGSITAGDVNTGGMESNWPYYIRGWLLSNFTGLRLTVCNGGIGGTGTLCGLMRCEKEMIAAGCDIVFLEYAVNDCYGDAELRRDLPKSFAGRTVERFTDYLASEKTGLPRSNVLRFDMRGARVIVRPSGTEPQMKVYLEASENEKANAELLCALEKEMRERFSSRG